ncbi:MAG TPA: Flp family type IVb pilin [Xanthobacteraceae bacterium]|jgi:pilus assembly protein Flp/PilA
MRRLINRFRVDERGATATEYAMLVVFIALAVATGAQAFSNGLNSWFNAVSTSITNLNSTIPGAP